MSRKVISISMPQKMAEEVKKRAQEGNYSSVSEYIRDLVRDRAEEREEGRMYRELMESEAEFKAGKGIFLKSLDDLDEK